VVAAALSVLFARRCVGDALLVDAGGDVPAVLGLAEPRGPGLADWIAAADEVQRGALRRIETPALPGLQLLHRGPGTITGSAAAHRLVDELSADERPVVIDAGGPSPMSFELAALATVSLLVLRPCFLALRRALAAPVRPSGVVLITEPDRVLDAIDVEDVLGVPVRAIVPWDPAIAKSVDTGLLGVRLPRPLAAALAATA
jgi:hypothetical protein